MHKIALPERRQWREKAKEVGFTFADMHGEPYWDETSAYRRSERGLLAFETVRRIRVTGRPRVSASIRS